MIKVVEIDQHQVKLGIKAPKDVKIDREEANKEEI
jgi:carbon storage regulator CsrA